MDRLASFGGSLIRKLESSWIFLLTDADWEQTVVQLFQFASFLEPYQFLFQKPERGRTRVHHLNNVNQAIKFLETEYNVSHFGFLLLTLMTINSCALVNLRLGPIGLVNKWTCNFVNKYNICGSELGKWFWIFWIPRIVTFHYSMNFFTIPLIVMYTNIFIICSYLHISRYSWNAFSWNRNIQEYHTIVIKLVIDEQMRETDAEFLRAWQSLASII